MNTTYKNALEVFVTTHQFGRAVEMGIECDCRLLEAASEYQALKEMQKSANGLCADNSKLRQELADVKQDFIASQKYVKALMDERVELLSKVAKAKRLLSQQALEYAFYGMQPPKDLLSWMEQTK
jgi:hypothetical protein